MLREAFQVEERSRGERRNEPSRTANDATEPKTGEW